MRLAVALAAALTIAVCAIGVVVGLVLAAPARRWLTFPFTGVPAEPQVAAGIFLHNLRALAAVGGLLLIAQSPYWCTRAAGPVHRTLQRVGEGLLAAGIAANLLVIGASLGAYGTRMVRAVLPHGPIELAAYALALALYLEGRHQPLPPPCTCDRRAVEYDACLRRGVGNVRERMRSARLLICTLAIAGGAALAVPLVLRAAHQLRTLSGPTPALPATPDPGGHAGPPAAGHHTRRPEAVASKRYVIGPVDAATHARRGGSLWLPRLIGVEIAGGLALLWLAALALVARRTRRRRTRSYALYELHLSTHDQTKGQDLEDMVESIANIVRAWPADRARHGQPYVALELICSAVEASGAGREMEWSINIRCEPKSVLALDGAISAAYPDVRLGRIHGEQPRPRAGVLREPGYVMRFRKERSFVYSLIADGERQASSPIEQIARAQVAQEAPSVVRFQLMPTPSFFEELARRQYRRHEHNLMRRERSGLREGGLWSTFNRAEMRAAERTQNRSLFWLETIVAAASREVCKAVAAAVQSRRGENRLHRRLMSARQGLYRRRFPRALGPLIPSVRCLVSAAEVAHLFELPPHG